MSKYTTLLFDFDGTVADTDPMIIAAMNILYDKYRGGRRSPVEKIVYFSGPPIRGTLKEEFPDMDIDFMYEEFRKLSIELYPSTVELFPHCRESLLSLKQKGYHIGLVTNKIRSSTLFCLNLLDLEGYFDVLMCFDDVKHPKPNGEPIVKAANELGEFDLNKVLYIGDNELDLVSADNAGVDCALVSWGPRKLGEHVIPKMFISSYEDLERKIEDENL